MSAADFYREGCSFTGHDYYQGSDVVGSRRYSDMIGATPLVCSIMWQMIDQLGLHPHGATFKHMLLFKMLSNRSF